MKRILVVSQHFWPESFRINDIVEGFLERGIEVDVLCGLPNYPKGEWFEGYRYTKPRRQNYHGAQVFRAGEIPRKGNKGATIFLNYVSWPFFALFHLWRLPGKYDAVFCFNTSPVLMAFPAIVYAKLHRIPLTTYVLDIWPENLYSVLPVKNAILRKVAHAVSDWHYRRSDKLIAMSQSLKQRLMERTGKTSKQVAVIPQHCEDFYAVARPDEKLAEEYAGRFVLAFTGNFSPAQSLETVIRGVVEAKRLGAERLTLLMVGDGMSRPELERLVEKLEAQDTVIFTGSVPPSEVTRFTTLADGLVISLSDSPDLGMTVPAKLSGYMAAGKPVLASMNGEGAWAVEQAQCGFTSPAEDASAFAANILQLYRMSPEERKHMGQRAFDCYDKLFRRDSVLDKLQDFLQ